MQELRKMAAMFIRVEDMRRYQDSVQSAPIPVEAKKTAKEPMTRESNCLREWKQARFSNYAPLNATKSRILDEVLQAALILLPRKFQNPPNVGMSKYCRYHRNNGHTTEECETLRDKIEEMIRAGHLKHYIQGTEGGETRPHYDRSDNRRFERRDERRPERREARREPVRDQNVE